MIRRTYARQTAPHLPTLADNIRALMAAANAGSFHVNYQNGQVIIEQGSWAGVNEAAVASAVAAAPDDGEKIDAKRIVNSLTLVERAIFLTILDGINVERARHGAAAITPAQWITSIIAKIDTL